MMDQCHFMPKFACGDIRHKEKVLGHEASLKNGYKTLNLRLADGRHFKSAEAKRHTLGELIDRFITQWLPKYPKRQVKQAALLTWWKNQAWSSLAYRGNTIQDIRSARCSACLSQLVRGALRSSSTVNRYLAALSKAISIAITEWGWLDDSPMRKVSKPSEAPGRNRFLNLEEKDRLLRSLQGLDKSTSLPSCQFSSPHSYALWGISRLAIGLISILSAILLLFAKQKMAIDALCP